MKLTIVGSGTGVPSLKRCSPCVVVEVAQSVAVLDTGPGSMRRMLEIDITYADVTALHYTHTHVDHVNDFAQFLFAAKYDESPRTEPLKITGPPGFKSFYERMVALYGDQIISDKYSMTLEELSKDERDYKDYSLKTRPMLHMVPCTGYRIEDRNGASVAYTGDTDYCESVVELAGGVDVLVIEAALPPAFDLEGHLEPEAAGRIAAEAGVGTLVITHLYPVCDRYDTEAEVRKSYGGDVIIAEDLLRLDI